MSIGSAGGELVGPRLAELSRSAGPLLVVLDNVVNWTAKTRPQPLPTGPVRMLVTTRKAHLGGNTFRRADLDMLNPEAARRLLESTAGRGSLADVDALLDYLGGHCHWLWNSLAGFRGSLSLCR